MMQREDVMRKVQALITRADHPNTPPAEAESARNMAEALMFKYRIEQYDLTDADKMHKQIAVEWREMDICEQGGEFAYFYRRLFAQVMNHFDIRGVTKVVRKEYGTIGTDDFSVRYMHVADVVGYEADLDFVEMMFTSARLEFGKRLEPRFDPELGEQVSAYLMRMAGMEGVRIAKAIWNDGKKANCVKARKLYRQEAEARGEHADMKGHQNLKLYRESYAEGFCTTFGHRLWMMRNSREGGAEIVLASRKDSIDEAFYAKYPSQRPQPASTPRIGNGTETCAKCAKAKSGYCNDHSYLRPRKAKTRYADNRAWDRGGDAALAVDMGITGRSLT